MKSVLLDQVKDFLVRRCANGGKFRKESQNFRAMGEIATSQFTDDEGMRCDLSRGEEVLKQRFASTQVIDPDGSVNQHGACHQVLRLGMERRPFSVPPRVARRFALSRAIRA